MYATALTLWLLVCVLAGPAYASCEQSLDVDPAKTIPSIGALMAMPEASSRPISCSTAERFREFLFIEGATKIDDSAFADLRTYQKTMRAQRGVLEKAIKDAEPNPARVLVDVALLEQPVALAA